MLNMPMNTSYDDPHHSDANSCSLARSSTRLLPRSLVCPPRRHITIDMQWLLRMLNLGSESRSKPTVTWSDLCAKPADESYILIGRNGSMSPYGKLFRGGTHYVWKLNWGTPYGPWRLEDALLDADVPRSTLAKFEISSHPGQHEGYPFIHPNLEDAVIRRSSRDSATPFVGDSESEDYVCYYAVRRVPDKDDITRIYDAVPAAAFVYVSDGGSRRTWHRIPVIRLQE